MDNVEGRHYWDNSDRMFTTWGSTTTRSQKTEIQLTELGYTYSIITLDRQNQLTTTKPQGGVQGLTDAVPWQLVPQHKLVV